MKMGWATCICLIVNVAGAWYITTLCPNVNQIYSGPSTDRKPTLGTKVTIVSVTACLPAFPEQEQSWRARLWMHGLRCRATAQPQGQDGVLPCQPSGAKNKDLRKPRATHRWHGLSLRRKTGRFVRHLLKVWKTCPPWGRDENRCSAISSAYVRCIAAGTKGIKLSQPVRMETTAIVLAQDIRQRKTPMPRCR